MNDDDDAAIRARLAVKNPACMTCGWPVAGQKNQQGRPEHFECHRLKRNPHNPHK
jgi:hypothetical protein